jgi:hypothetical protein
MLHIFGGKQNCNSDIDIEKCPTQHINQSVAKEKKLGGLGLQPYKPTQL